MILIRLKWSDEEVGYITRWIQSNPCAPVRALYNNIMQSPSAKKIFAYRHIADVGRLDYQFKKVRKALILKSLQEERLFHGDK